MIHTYIINGRTFTRSTERDFTITWTLPNGRTLFEIDEDELYGPFTDIGNQIAFEGLEDLHHTHVYIINEEN